MSCESGVILMTCTASAQVGSGVNGGDAQRKVVQEGDEQDHAMHHVAEPEVTRTQHPSVALAFFLAWCFPIHHRQGDVRLARGKVCM